MQTKGYEIYNLTFELARFSS
ncbi:hypothetical protein SPRA44_20019 [Serratia proteamaculans]|nr:hypothetical protein SPRA44_20019 [Serratia proteamaculans]